MNYKSFGDFDIRMKDSLEGKFLEDLNSNVGIIHRVCRIYCSDTEAREDMFQEIVYQLWKSYPGFKGGAKFSTWMYRVALNTAMGGLRKQYKSVVNEPLSDRLIQSKAQEEDHTSDKMTWIYAAMQQLSEVDRAIIMLYLEDYDNDQISSVMGISKNHVSVKLVRIKKKLEVLLKDKF